MNRVALLLVLVAVSLPSFAQVARPSVYIEPQNGLRLMSPPRLRKSKFRLT